VHNLSLRPFIPVGLITDATGFSGRTPIKRFPRKDAKATYNVDRIIGSESVCGRLSKDLWGKKCLAKTYWIISPILRDLHRAKDDNNISRRAQNLHDILTFDIRSYGKKAFNAVHYPSAATRASRYEEARVWCESLDEKQTALLFIRSRAVAREWPMSSKARQAIGGRVWRKTNAERIARGRST